MIERLSEIITDTGAIIIAEAQRNYTKTMLRALAMDASRMGLNVYYPCPLPNCPYVGYSPYCWVWRYHSYLPPNGTGTKF